MSAYRIGGESFIKRTVTKCYLGKVGRYFFKKQILCIQPSQSAFPPFPPPKIAVVQCIQTSLQCSEMAEEVIWATLECQHQFQGQCIEIVLHFLPFFFFLPAAPPPAGAFSTLTDPAPPASSSVSSSRTTPPWVASAARRLPFLPLGR